jgi:hypothetical protein
VPLRSEPDTGPKPRTSPWELAVAPAPDKGDDWTELDPAAWPERVEKHYALIPTISFNCELACGLVAYVDKECAKGPATIHERRLAA